MSLDVGRYKLYASWKSIHERWESTRMSWHDVVREEFGKEFWADVEPRVLSTLSAIDRLGQVLGSMKQDCGT